MTKRIAIYPGTFNPVTNGHLDIVHRATHLFDQIIVAVADSSRKNPFLSLEQRIDLAEKTFAHFDIVSVTRLDGLLVNFAKKHKANFILRGLRAVSDFDYEFQLAGMNRKMAPGIETVFLPASESQSFISATMVREISELGGDVSLFVPQVVSDFLKK